MGLFNWLTGSFSNRGKALFHYRRGMLRAKRHNHLQAINDYTVAIDMPNGPADVRAMALYNRALVHAAAGDNSQAALDLREVLARDESPANVRTAARQKLVRMHRQQPADNA